MICLCQFYLVPVPSSEHRYIAKIKEWTGSSFIGDDCAILPGWGLVSSDTLVEGTHFRLDWTDLVSLGFKACAVNLSDIAAMAGRPRFVTAAITMPRDFGESELRRLYQGLTDCAATYRTKIVGGDLTSGDKLVINLTVLGDVHECGVMKRSTARDGELVIGTGNFGASGAALSLLNRQTDLKEGRSASGLFRPGSSGQELLDAHFKPLPRLCQSWSLVRLTKGQGSLMDASDGLADALVQICQASQVDMEIDLDKIPVSQAVRQYAQEWQKDELAYALYGGEDYELVGTISEAHWPLLKESEPSFSLFGRVVQSGSPGNVQFFEGGKKSKRLGGQADLSNCFQHFW